MVLTIPPEPPRHKGFQLPVKIGNVYNHDELMGSQNNMVNDNRYKILPFETISKV